MCQGHHVISNQIRKMNRKNILLLQCSRQKCFATTRWRRRHYEKKKTNKQTELLHILYIYANYQAPTYLRCYQLNCYSSAEKFRRLLFSSERDMRRWDYPSAISYWKQCDFGSNSPNSAARVNKNIDVDVKSEIN